jgi:ribokinase
MKTKKIIVIGSSNTDMVVKSQRLPLPGETILGGDFLMNPGGKGANQAVAVSRLGGNVTFVCKTGNDLFGIQAGVHYKNEGINTDYIFRDKEKPSGVALICVDAAGENSIVVASGANATLSVKDINRVSHEIAFSDYVLMQLEIPVETVAYVARTAFEKGVKVILNPAPARLLPDELYSHLYMIVPNKNEAEMLSGIPITDWSSAEKAATAIREKGVQIVVITLGGMGALIANKGQFIQVSVQAVDPIDTTAAGDTFCGALTVALAEGKSIYNAVVFANQAASYTVMRMGAQSSIPYRNEIMDSPSDSSLTS